MKAAILIPACNEAESIPSLIGQLPKTLAGVSDILPIVIDDGSTDGTAEHARAAGAHVVQHGRNLGLASTFRTAVQTALTLDADIAVTMDADLQFYPDDIPALLEPILSDRADFVAGNRFPDGQRPEFMPKAKYTGNRLMTFAVNRMTSAQFSDVSSGFRAYSREALFQLNVQSGFTYTQETFIELAAKGLRIEQVPVRVTYYKERRSYISGNLVRYGIRTLLTIARTARDYAPLRIFGTAAWIVGVPGMLLGMFVLGHYIATGSFTPYIFLAFTAAYLFTLGLGIFCLALAADMLRAIRTNQERLLYFSKVSHFGR